VAVADLSDSGGRVPRKSFAILAALPLAAGLGIAGAVGAPPGWSAPQVLVSSASDSTEYSSPAVTADSGNAVVAWTRRLLLRPMAPWRLQLSERRGLAGVWTRPTDIRIPATGFAAPTSVRVNARGDIVILLTIGAQDSALLVAATRKGLDGVWRVGALARVSSSYTRRPLLALDGTGRVTVAWVNGFPGKPFVIRVARGAVGRAAWRLSRDILRVQPHLVAGMTGGPSLALNGRGQLLAGWREPVGSATRLLSALRGPGGPWQTPQVIAESEPNGTGPSVALSPGGSMIAGWAGPPAVVAPKRVALRPREASAWGPAETVGSGEGGMFVALSDRGDALAQWGTGAETTQLIQIFAALRRAGQAWPAPALLHSRNTSGTPLFVTVPAASVSNDGTAFVFIGEEERASFGATLAALNTPAVGQWSVQGIRQHDRPEPAVGSDGSALVGWSGSQGISVMQYIPPAARS
jgi:hypothetical protein